MGSMPSSTRRVNICVSVLCHLPRSAGLTSRRSPALLESLQCLKYLKSLKMGWEHWWVMLPGTPQLMEPLPPAAASAPWPARIPLLPRGRALPPPFSL